MMLFLYVFREVLYKIDLFLCIRNGANPAFGTFFP